MTTMLPARLAPRPRETLASLFDRLSAAVDLPLGQLLEAVGLPSTYQRGYGTLLHPALIIDVADALGLDIATVQNCTLHGLRHTVPEPRPQDWNHLGLWASRHAISLSGTRYCPPCLRESGSYRLEWRLPEVIGCPVHRCLLADTCAACQRPPHSGPRVGAGPNFLSYIREPGRCFNQPRPDLRGHGCAAPPCGGHLATVATPLMTVEQFAFVTNIQRLHEGEPVTLAGLAVSGQRARALIREALAIQRLLDRRAQLADQRPRARGYRTTVGVTVNDTTTFLPRLWAWLDQDTPEDAGAALSQAIELSRWQPTLGQLRAALPSEATLEPLLRSALRRHGRLALRANRLRRAAPTANPSYATALPQRIWLCGLPSLPTSAAGLPATPYLQVAMSMLLARRFTTTWAAAANLLCLPGHAVGWNKHVLARLAKAQLTEQWHQQSEPLHQQLAAHGPMWKLALTPAVHTLPSLSEGVCAPARGLWCPCSAAPAQVEE